MEQFHNMDYNNFAINGLGSQETKEWTLQIYRRLGLAILQVRLQYITHLCGGR